MLYPSDVATMITSSEKPSLTSSNMLGLLQVPKNPIQIGLNDKENLLAYMNGKSGDKVNLRVDLID